MTHELRSLVAARAALAAVAVLALFASGCAIDGLFFTEVARQDHVRVPAPAPQTLTGTVPQAPGAAIQLFGANGKALDGLAATADGLGAFAVEIEGTRTLTNAILQAQSGPRQLLAIVPSLPAQTSVLNPPQTYDLKDLSPGALQVDATTTAMTVLVMGRLRANGQSLAATSPYSINQALIALHQGLVQQQAELTKFAELVAQLTAVDAAAGGAVTPLRLMPLQGASFLDPAFLAAQPVDYTGDGAADTTTDEFDAALAAAVDKFAIKGCFQPDRIRVVLMTRVVASPKNANCETFSPWKAADDKPTSTVFVTGGIHKETVACSAGRTSYCLTQPVFDAAHASLGSWKPNQLAMYDDATHGDETANDGIWSLAFDLPYWDPALAPDKSGVRIAYKFTYGSQGQTWTGSEEFPGNQRVLELKDVNGDGLVTRFDLFADETTNKDKSNDLASIKGGCGQMKWQADTVGECASDTVERKVDLDGDCVIDGWPGVSASPLTITCPES